LANISRVVWFSLDCGPGIGVAAYVLAAVDRVGHIDIGFRFVKFLEFEETLCTRLGLDADFSIARMLLEGKLGFRFHQRKFESTKTTHDVEDMIDTTAAGIVHNRQIV